MPDRGHDRVGGKVAVHVACKQAVLERPARIEDPLEALAHEELVLLFQLGVVALVTARSRDVQPPAQVLVWSLGAGGRFGIRAHSATSIRSSEVLNALPVTSYRNVLVAPPPSALCRRRLKPLMFGIGKTSTSPLTQSPKWRFRRSGVSVLTRADTLVVEGETADDVAFVSRARERDVPYQHFTIAKRTNERSLLLSGV
jgi:hypothetical protein